jgi:hypothetical protein
MTRGGVFGRLRAPRPRGRTCGCARPRCGAGPDGPTAIMAPKVCLPGLVPFPKTSQVKNHQKTYRENIQIQNKNHRYRLYFDRYRRIMGKL